MSYTDTERKAFRGKKAALPDAPMEPPYEGAKEMLLVEDVDDKEFLKELFEGMYEELPAPKPRKKRFS